MKTMETYLVVKTPFDTYRLKLKDVLDALGIHGAAEEAGLMIEKNGQMLYASTMPNEEEYPGIMVDGKVRYEVGDVTSGDLFWLGNFELPNPTYPHDMTARLYAGSASYEHDGPIALVKHQCDDMETNMKRANDNKAYHKIVYIDTEIAQDRPWAEAEPMPEHVEDSIDWQSWLGEDFDFAKYVKKKEDPADGNA